MDFFIKEIWKFFFSSTRYLQIRDRSTDGNINEQIYNRTIKAIQENIVLLEGKAYQTNKHE